MISRCLAIVWLVLVVLGVPERVGAQDGDNAFAEGDVLEISVYGRDDLSGKYRVQSNRFVSLPLIGAVDLAGLSARDLEANLAKTWEDRLGAPLSVSVEFAERAPFYILGDVNAPGAYPYRHGLTVLQAVAVGGGLRQLALADPRLRMDLMRERERRAHALDVLAQGMIERARLTAEIHDAIDFQIPPPLADISSQENTGALVSRQMELMKSRNQQHQLKKALLEERIALEHEEIKAYEEQYKALEKQERGVSEELSRVEKLRESGFGLQSRVFDMQQRLSSLYADKIGALAAVAKAKSGLASSRNALKQLNDERRQAIGEALVEVDKRIRDAELIERAAAHQIRAAGLSVDNRKQNPQFRLQRVRDDGGLRSVGPSDAIKPGDVIEVWIPADDLTGSLRQSSAAELDQSE